MEKTISAPFFKAAYMLYPRYDPRIRPRSKVRKPLKRPALQGDVIWAGATCDARPLSCSFFEPSVLPWPWAFCRAQALENSA